MIPEPLLRDEPVTDVVVNRPRQMFVERNGKPTLPGVHFRDDAHVTTIVCVIIAISLIILRGDDRNRGGT
ncbi:hypothetical protein [Inquilinus sp. CAU 1745]|uniref:hypothetical protein n=1 Tax=Inquilinus sp. CAU 1745 TaxID=3140369 RepID=UPI00325ABD62